MSKSIVIPTRASGTSSAAARREYQEDLQCFCDLIHQVNSTLDLVPGSRGWCYLLEFSGLDKNDFDKAQKLIGQCRKAGLIPLEFVAEDSGREWHCQEFMDYAHPSDEAEWQIKTTFQAWKKYRPFSFWDDQEYYIQMFVEKVDLLSLFHPVCREYPIPIANAGGWSDLNSRASMMKRFKKWEKRGKQCVLLYCGDHDPAGLKISDVLRKNLKDLSKAVGWSPDHLIIDRFGLNHDLIKKLGLTWIENLITSRKDSKGNPQDLGDLKHRDHFKPYVQSYKKLMLENGEAVWRKKCEANALIVRPREGRELCKDAIHRYLPLDAVKRYNEKVKPFRVQLQKEIKAKMRKIFG